MAPNVCARTTQLLLMEIDDLDRWRPLTDIVTVLPPEEVAAHYRASMLRAWLR